MNSAFQIKDLRGLKVTVMGLGLHGGGIETCRFLSRHGANVTVTDQRNAQILAPALEQIADCQVRVVLGHHDEADFRHADMVIKNPAVRPGNPFIALSKRVETDLSLFLNLVSNPVIGVTGSKGKSTTSSAIFHGLLATHPKARLGGNITISPLSFFEELDPQAPLVLELSSFQLGDLANSWSYRQQGRLRAFPPRIAVMTSLFHDHQDYYGAMEPYLADKALLFRDQGKEDHLLLRTDDDFSLSMAANAPSRLSLVEPRPGKSLATNQSGAFFDDHLGGWYSTGQKQHQILPSQLKIKGEHHRSNLLQAAAALWLYGLDADLIQERLGNFAGIEHRLEPCGTIGQVQFINDSAATIPEAALAAVQSLDAPVHLLTGGTDKKLDFTSFVQTARKTASITLLKGTASDAISLVLQKAGLPYAGPFDNLELAVRHCLSQADKQGTVVLSPGCASFGMFLNEFDRGRQFKAIVAGLIAEHTSR